jgi:hypothetical protein
MSKFNKLEYNALRLEELFAQSEKYEVPRYQRGYAWTDDLVGELLSDLHESYTHFPDEDYLLGQMIVCPKSNVDKTWELIDGQQRTTTLYLLILVAYNKLKDSDVVKANFEAIQKFGLYPTHLAFAKGNDLFPRVKVAADGEEYIKTLLDGKNLTQKDKSPTQKNIRSAYEAIEGFFSSELDGDSQKIWDFLTFALENVILVRLELTDSSHALRVFLKVNNRGLSLDDADLLKSLLFRKVAGQDAFETLSKRWDKASEELFKSRLKRMRSMEFLMKNLIGIKTGKSVSTGRVFDEWEKQLVNEAQAVDFATGLPKQAKNLRLLSNQQNPLTETEATLLVGTHLFKMVQHFEVLLAGTQLSATSFEALMQIVEERAVLSSLSGEKNQAFERIIHPWAEAVSKLGEHATPDEVKVASAKASEGLGDLLVAAQAKISTLRYSTQSHQIKLRYLLGRIARDFQQSDGLSARPLGDYMSTSKSEDDGPGFDIDHVFPKSEAKRADWVGEDYDLIHSIGNLVLLHPGDNRSQSDALPWDTQQDKDGEPVTDGSGRVIKIKQSVYASSGLLINKTLVPLIDLGPQRPEQVRAIETLQLSAPPSLDSWDSQAILNRQSVYWEILERQFLRNLPIEAKP